MSNIELEKEYTYKQWTWHAEGGEDGDIEIYIGGRYLLSIDFSDFIITKKDVEFRIQTALDELKDLADVFQIKIEEF
jgi:hypothetical protein